MVEINIATFLVVKQSLAGEHAAAEKEDAIAAAALHTVNVGGCDTDDPQGGAQGRMSDLIRLSLTLRSTESARE
jgi:hypothetical protein